MLGGRRNCSEDAPCRDSEPCDQHLAARYLTGEDWQLIEFYQLVHDQYINQTPMGTDKGPAIVTIRYEAIEAALRVHGYQRVAWWWFARWAVTLHRLVNKTETINWYAELGKSYRDVRGEDVI